MINITILREEPEKIKKACLAKGVDSEVVDRVIKVDEERRHLIGEIEKLRARRNQLTREQIEEARKIKETLQKMEPDLKALEEQLKNLLYQIPNPAAPDVPEGKDETENVELRKWGEPKKFDFKPKDHLELGKDLNLIDIERAAKVSGSRFSYLKNEAVLLELAMVKLALDLLIKEGFEPVIPPVMISQDSMRGMGYLEHNGQDEMYVLEKDNLVLVGTSEQSIGPMHKGEIFSAEVLPKRYVGFSTCFRREAGSYGKDTKGILRVHQFNKVEMFSYTLPDQSDKEHEYLLSLEEKLMQALELPYRVMKMCAGDLGAAAARKYDIEAWFPAQNCYRETHSTSTCTDFQARRLGIKYRQGNATGLVHTLNGTAFSERPILAILENYQQKDGSVVIPKVLQPFVGKEKITPKL